MDKKMGEKDGKSIPRGEIFNSKPSLAACVGNGTFAGRFPGEGPSTTATIAKVISEHLPSTPLCRQALPKRLPPLSYLIFTTTREGNVIILILHTGKQRNREVGWLTELPALLGVVEAGFKLGGRVLEPQLLLQPHSGMSSEYGVH